MITTKYPEVKVQLTGEDGNAFFIIGRVTAALRRKGVKQEEIAAFQDECTAAKSYDHFLQTVMRWVEVH